MQALSSRLNGYSPSIDISNAAQGLIQKLRHSYSGLPSDVRSLVHEHLPARADFVHARHELDDVARTLVHFLKNTRLFLLAGGTGYALYVSCRYCSEERMVEKMNARIRRKPLKSALVALGIGLVVGKIL